MPHTRMATVSDDDRRPAVRHAESTALRESLSSTFPLSVPLRLEIAPGGRRLPINVSVEPQFLREQHPLLMICNTCGYRSPCLEPYITY